MDQFSHSSGGPNRALNPEELREAIEQSADVDWEVADEPIDLEQRLGYLPSRGVPPLEEQIALGARAAAEAPPREPTYPPAVDLRATPAGNMITGVRDQGNCLSCVAFAACATVEGTLGVERGQPVGTDLSEAYLFYCKAAAENRECGQGPRGGWYPKAALDACKEGVPDEACFPYTSWDQPCTACADSADRMTTIARWQALHSPPQAKEWLAKRGPTIGSMAVFQDLAHYSGGVYSHITGAETGGHCVCVVGYDDNEGNWIVKNSWGTRWGEAGFFRIAYGQCGIDSGMLGVEGVRPPNA